MCGIIGVISHDNAQNTLLKALKTMEYRGYDSAGICIVQNNTLQTTKAKGKLKHLEALVAETPLQGRLGIGHTRWATHGVPEVRNAHPHQTETVSYTH